MTPIQRLKQNRSLSMGKRAVRNADHHDDDAADDGDDGEHADKDGHDVHECEED